MKYAFCYIQAIVLAMVAIHMVRGQNIVEVKSQLKIYKAKNNKTKTEELENTVRMASLWVYQDLDNYQANLTLKSDQILGPKQEPVHGLMLMCYVAEDTADASFNKYVKECREAYINAQNTTNNTNSTNGTSGNVTKKAVWTLVSNADREPSQNLDLLKRISSAEQEESAVQGLIMISDQEPPLLDDTEPGETKKFTWPPLLARAGTKHIKDLRPFCYNSPDYAAKKNQTLEFEHQFIENCTLLDGLLPFLASLSAFGLIFGAVWIFYQYKMVRGRRYLLQTWLTMLPIVKAVGELQEMMLYSTCPWTSDSSMVVISLFSSQVLSVVTVICFNTLLCCIFYLMSLGWNITMFRIKRTQLTNLIFVGGSLYLVQLAQDYSTSESVIPFLFAIALFFEYFALAVITLRNTRALSLSLAHMVDPDQLLDIPEACHESLKLKDWQLRRFFIALTIFFTGRLFAIIYGITDYLADFENAYRRQQIAMLGDIVDMIAFTMIMFTFRPRRQWPEFYGVDIDTAKNSIFRSKQRPIMQATLNDALVVDLRPAGSKTKPIKQQMQLHELTEEQFDDVTASHYHPFVSIGLKEPVLVLNPCEMTHEEFIQDFHGKDSQGQTQSKQSFKNDEALEDNPYTRIQRRDTTQSASSNACSSIRESTTAANPLFRYSQHLNQDVVDDGDDDQQIQLIRGLKVAYVERAQYKRRQQIRRTQTNSSTKIDDKRKRARTIQPSKKALQLQSQSSLTSQSPQDLGDGQEPEIGLGEQKLLRSSSKIRFSLKAAGRTSAKTAEKNEPLLNGQSSGLPEICREPSRSYFSRSVRATKDSALSTSASLLPRNPDCLSDLGSPRAEADDRQDDHQSMRNAADIDIDQLEQEQDDDGGIDVQIL